MKFVILTLTAVSGLSFSSCAVSEQEVIDNIGRASSIAIELAPLIVTKQK